MTELTIVEVKPRRRIAYNAKKGTKAKRKPKSTISGLLRDYEVPERIIRVGKAALRYVSPLEKGVLWYFTSLYVRMRDVKQWGTCVSCGRPITVETSQAGHFIPAASCGRDLLFDLRNLNAECAHCNAWDELHLIGYAKNLDQRYGERTSDVLLEIYREYKQSKQPRKDFTKAEYRQKIHYVKELIQSL